MTAPAPRLTAALDAAWEKIAKAVEAGLNPKDPPADSALTALLKVCVIDAADLPEDITPSVSQSSHDLTREQLAEVSPTELTEWALRARLQHLTEVVSALASKAPDPPLAYSEDGLAAARPHGQGGLRLIHLQGDRAVADAFLKKGLVVQVLDVSPAGIQLPAPCGALLVHEFGGPYVRRPKDLTLGWDLVDSSTVRLVLETRWCLARAETVHGKPPVVRLA